MIYLRSTSSWCGILTCSTRCESSSTSRYDSHSPVNVLSWYAEDCDRIPLLGTLRVLSGHFLPAVVGYSLWLCAEGSVEDLHRSSWAISRNMSLARSAFYRGSSKRTRHLIRFILCKCCCTAPFDALDAVDLTIFVSRHSHMITRRPSTLIIDSFS